jgi:hypothetical protein
LKWFLKVVFDVVVGCFFVVGGGVGLCLCIWFMATIPERATIPIRWFLQRR